MTQKPHDETNKCQVCGNELRAHEAPEQFCDLCLKKAETWPILEHDRREGVRS
jgi:CRISPR/Cas system-associated protein Cas10 (large subunit of type III CRISPR-Cas system)